VIVGFIFLCGILGCLMMKPNERMIFVLGFLLC